MSRVACIRPEALRELKRPLQLVKMTFFPQTGDENLSAGAPVDENATRTRRYRRIAIPELLKRQPRGPRRSRIEPSYCELDSLQWSLCDHGRQELAETASNMTIHLTDCDRPAEVEPLDGMTVL